MRGGWVSLVGVTALLGACQSNQLPRNPDIHDLAYREPVSGPRSVPASTVTGTSRDLIDNALTQLYDDRFEVSLADPDRGLFILTYTGGPEDFVDCGAFLVRGEGSEQWYDTTAQKVSLRPFSDYPDWVANREMRLDARIVAQLQPAAGQTKVDTETVYVLSQLVDVIDSDGLVRSQTRETIDFLSGQSGQFVKGTHCVPNGELERQVASLFDRSAASVASTTPAEQPSQRPEPSGASSGSGTAVATAPSSPAPLTESPATPSAPEEAPLTTAAVPPRFEPSRQITSMDCADVDVARTATRGIVITGVVANDNDRQTVVDETQSNADGQAVVDELALLPPGGCEAIELARSLGTEALPQFAVKLDGNADQLPEGTKVDLDVTLPGSNRYFYVGYIQEDGVIHHLGPKFIDGDSVGERFLFRTGYEVVPPFGPEMILVIASREPIFSQPRASAEQASSFLRALRARLEEAPQADAVADTMIIRTVP